MGCGAAKVVQNDEQDSSAKEVPKPVAFEIPVDVGEAVNNGDSIVKKHPPKRLQRLEEQPTPTLTAKEIEEKQQKAEERRLEIIEEKVNKARIAQKGSEKSPHKECVEPSDEQAHVAEPEAKKEPDAEAAVP